MDYPLLGSKIKHARKVRNMTQADLARAIGRSTSFIGHVERGSRIASLDTFQSICYALDISADYVLGKPGQDFVVLTEKELNELEYALEYVQDALRRYRERVQGK